MSVYNDSIYLTTSLDWNRAADCNNKPTRRKRGEKIAREKNIRKATWNSEILKNKPKDRESNFLVVFSSSKASKELLREEKGQLTDVGHNELCSTCSTSSQIRKDEIIQTSPVVAINRLKDPPTSPQPPPTHWNRDNVVMMMISKCKSKYHWSTKAS